MSHELDFSQVLDYRGTHMPPYYATRNAAGLDLSAAFDTPVTLFAYSQLLVPTGLWLHLPENSEMQIRGRSGLALKGILAFNGTIDADYKDQVGVILFNHTAQSFIIEPGQKIAQGVFAPVFRAVQGFTANTKERVGGFGSTDKRHE